MKITKLYPPDYNSFVLDNLPIKTQTLFGALANSYSILFGSDNFDNFINLFEKGKISSVFPAIKIGEEKEIFFIPKPYIAKSLSNDDRKNISLRKKIKKIKWLSFKAIEELGKKITTSNEKIYHQSDFLNDFYLIGKEFLISKEELDSQTAKSLEKYDFIKKRQTVRVYVPRFKEDSLPYDQEEVHLNTIYVKSSSNNKMIKVKAFLFFLEDIEENNEWEATKGLFIEEGIGGKRSIGKGLFEKYITEKLSFDLQNDKKFSILLSSYIPKKDELESLISYNLKKDDGFITFSYSSTIKKDPLFYLTEGSVIKGSVTGKIIKQKFKEKYIYRYGKAFLFPLGG